MKLSVIDLGLKLFKWISRKQYFQMSEERLKEEMKFLNSLPEPEDDIERSYNQYLCKMFHMNILFRIFLNITAFVLFLPTLVFLRCRTVAKQGGGTDAVYILSESNKNLLSAGLRQRYPRIIFDGGASKMILRSRDVAFIRSVLRKKPGALFFVFKILLKLALYRSIIEQYNPSAIITSSEYSFLSSVLTAYCETEQLEHVDVMHGERYLEIESGFFRFTYCYVWLEYYVYIFHKLRAYPDQFLIACPPALSLEGTSPALTEETADFTYYLTEHTPEELRNISRNMNALLKEGYAVKVRPHPRYCTFDIAVKYFEKEMLEDNSKISIESSLSATKRVIGINSTVLLQGHLSGKEVVLDDRVYNERIRILKTYEYIILNGEIPVKYLSEYLA